MINRKQRGKHDRNIPINNSAAYRLLSDDDCCSSISPDVLDDQKIRRRINRTAYVHVNAGRKSRKIRFKQQIQAQLTRSAAKDCNYISHQFSPLGVSGIPQGWRSPLGVSIAPSGNMPTLAQSQQSRKETGI